MILLVGYILKHVDNYMHSEIDSMDCIAVSGCDTCCIIQLLCHILLPPYIELLLSSYQPLAVLDHLSRSDQCVCVLFILYSVYLEYDRIHFSPIFHGVTPTSPPCHPLGHIVPSISPSPHFSTPPTAPPTLPLFHAETHWWHRSGIPQPANPHPCHHTPLLGCGWLTSMFDGMRRGRVGFICGEGAGIRTRSTVV